MTRSFLTFSSSLVLHAIASGRPYGFDIMDATGLPSGTVYPALRKLERSGFVRSKWESERSARREQRPVRRYYEVTAAGVRALEAATKKFHGIARVLPSEG